MLPRPYSLASANALLAHIVESLAHAREAMSRAYAARNEMTARAVREGEEAVIDHAERYPDLMAAVEEAEDEASDELDLLQRMGVIVMSVTPGMVAVSTRRAGLPALLLWRDGDEEFAYWRLAGDDEAEVKPIVDPDLFESEDETLPQ